MQRFATNLAVILLAALPSPNAGATSGQPSADEAGDSAFSMTVMDAFKIAGKGVIITGRIDSGTVRTGDSVCLTAAKIGTRTLTVEAVENFGRSLESAHQGDSVGILVNGVDKQDISRSGSDKLSASCTPP